MATRSERDKQKAQQEKFQAILTNLLKDEDNKYCVDCDAKGPRWASWNLGVFLCIRCAGIHRNLGVHISKVKSVNLDSWTAEQIAMMQEMGNSRARAVYEANIPDNFRRPQTDSSLEAFIRAKYEQKKYQAQGWIPPKPVLQPMPEDKKEKKKSRPRPTSNSSSPGNTLSRPEVKTSVSATSAPAKPTPALPPEPHKSKESNIDDLLGLDEPQPVVNHATSDPFSDFITAPAGEGETSSAAADLSSLAEEKKDSKSTKESILALYGSSGNQQQYPMQGGGMYMGGQQPVMQNGAPMNMMPGHMMQPNMPHGTSLSTPNLMVIDPMTEVQHSLMASYQIAGHFSSSTPALNSPYLQAQQQQQQMMMMNQMGRGGMMMGGMPQQQMMMQQPTPNMYMPNMYNMQQMSSQMASMNLGGGMNGYQQTAAGMGGWGAQTTAGHTLSTNLWQ